MKKIKNFLKDNNALAVVEATILFPIMFMIFAALVLLAVYLPQRAILQEAAQVAATVIATEKSDTWIAFDNNANQVTVDNLPNVYVSAIQGAFLNKSTDEDRVQAIVKNIAAKGIFNMPHEIIVDYDVVNYVIYQELLITVTQTIPTPVNLSFIGFPDKITITQEARAVIQNGDEFVRNIDIAKDMVIWLDKKLGMSASLKDSAAFEKIREVLDFFGF